MVTLALLHVLPPHSQREGTEDRPAPQRAPPPLSSAVVFHRFRHSLIYVAFIEQFASWEMTWKSALPHVPLARNAKRLRFVICSIWQTQWRVWSGRGLT